MAEDRSKCSRCGTVLSMDRNKGVCSECQNLSVGLLEEETMKLWEDSLTPEMTSEDSIRSGSWHTLSDSLPPPSARSLGTMGSKDAGPVDFEIRQKLGAGGMGVVYAAHQASVNREVALKMVKPEHEASASAAEALMSEAVVTGCLDHPNVVPVYDLGVDGDGHVFYAMKEVEGHPWSVLISEKTLDENLDILLRVADTISFAHSKGILHRDLKPQNIMLGAFGEIMVMDWGAACSLGGVNVIGLLPSDTAYCGTPVYMAPEMAKADKNRMGEASDVYLLGAILYQIITGRPPRREKDPRLCLLAAAENHIDPVEEDGELLRIALRAMATAPADRYPDAKSFQEALREYRSHSESLILLANSKANLDRAKEEQDYELFNRAVYGLREALELWEGNLGARELLKEATLDYAQCAFARSDYDLAQSLLDENEVGHKILLGSIEVAIKERDSRKKRMRRLVLTARTLLVLTALVFGVAFFMIRAEQKETERQRVEANVQRVRATSEHRKSLISLIPAHYGVQHYEAAVAVFWQLYDQYGMEGLDEESLLKVRIAEAMNPWRGSIDTGITNVQKMVQCKESRNVWVVGGSEACKIQLNSEFGYEKDPLVSIKDYGFGKWSPPGRVVNQLQLPGELKGGSAFYESDDGTLWAGCGSVIYRLRGVGEEWEPVLDVGKLTFPPLSFDYGLSEKELAVLHEKMNMTAKAWPVSALLPNKNQSHIAVVLGGGVLCWINLLEQQCDTWFFPEIKMPINSSTTRGNTVLRMSPNERWLLCRPGSDNTFAYVFDLVNGMQTKYFAGRNRVFCDFSFSPENQLWGLHEYCGEIFSADQEAIAQRSNPYRYDLPGEWDPLPYGRRWLTLRDWDVATLSPDGTQALVITKDGILFSGSTVDLQGFDFQQNIPRRDLVDCAIENNGVSLLLSGDGRLHCYDTKSLSLKPLIVDGDAKEICQGERPDQVFAIVEQEGGSRKVYEISNAYNPEPESRVVPAPRDVAGIVCDPKGRWLIELASPNKYYAADLKLATVLEQIPYPYEKNAPAKFSDTGDYLIIGGNWSQFMRILRAGDWSEAFTEAKPGFHDAIIEKDAEGGDRALISSAEGPVRSIKLPSFSGSNIETVSERAEEIIAGSGTVMTLMPQIDKQSGRELYWCRYWGDIFKKRSLPDGEGSAMYSSCNHWVGQELRTPVFNPYSDLVVLPMQDGRLDIALKSDLYPIFDSRAMNFKLDRVVLNSDGTHLYLLSDGKVYIMQLPCLDGQE